MLSNTFRVYGQNNGYSTNHLKYLSSAFSGVNTSIRPIWGLLYDAVGFKVLLIPVNLLICTIGFGFYFTVNEKILFTVCVVLVGLLMSVLHSILPAYISKQFGLKFSSEIFGIIFLGIGFGNVLGPSFYFLVSKSIKVSANFFPFKVAYFIGGGFSFMAMILSCFSPKERSVINK